MITNLQMSEAKMRDPKTSFSFQLEDEAATARLAYALFPLLEAPFFISLQGDLGVGKSAFARAFIQAQCGAETIVPSPSFTLMQHYEAPRGDILHADLYRLSSPEEVHEMGLMEALDSHLCLIEWSANGDGVLPAADLIVELDMLADAPDARVVTLTCEDAALLAKLRASVARDGEIAAFLADTAWGAADATRAPLAGDASTRRYERLTAKHDGTSAVLMDWVAGADGPAVYNGQSYSKVAHLAEAAPAYCRMNRWLEARDLVVPHLIAADEAAGLVLMQDLGDTTLAALAKDQTRQQNDVPLFYAEAIATLLHLHGYEAADFLDDFDGTVQAVEASLFLDWYLPWRGVAVSDAARADWQALWQRLGDGLMQTPKVSVLRDYHSVNLLWQGGAQARYRVGLIDVQDALAGHPAYDLVSLLQDARINVAPQQVARSYAAYTTARFQTEDDIAAFGAAYAVAGAQRNLKIAGIFVRLCQRDGKAAYLDHLPRILGYIQDNLAHPALAEVAAWMQAHAPEALDADGLSLSESSR
jgi:tRNA threonylcarbamoyl adenosine modification protein YjeE